MDEQEHNPLVWIGSTLDDLKDFPEEVQDVMGYALHVAQEGGKHSSAKPMKGYDGAGVLEVVDDFDGDTYRAVYTIRLKGVVYVLHAFQKKSKQGIKTPPQDLKLVKQRLRAAEEHYKSNFSPPKGGNQK